MTMMRIAVLGTRGVPARYSGFETLAEELGSRLAARGHQVSVFTRRHMAQAGLDRHRGMVIRLRPALRLRAFETLSHTALSCLDIDRGEFDVALVCNAANAPLIPLLHRRKVPVALNVDGLERARRKWGALGKLYYLLCERLSARWADELITDAEVMRRYYRLRWRRDSTMVPYGGDLIAPTGRAALDHFDLEPGGYILYVSRFEPENNPDRVIESYRGVPGDHRLVLIGGAPYNPGLTARVQALAARDSRVLLTGFVYGDGYRELLFNAGAYIQATEVGGTHPALVEAMGAGRPVFYLDNPPNREVVAGAGVPFRFAAEPTLTTTLSEFVAEPARFARLGAQARQRVLERYRWDDVTDSYERVFAGLIGRRA